MAYSSWSIRDAPVPARSKSQPCVNLRSRSADRLQNNGGITMMKSIIRTAVVVVLCLSLASLVIGAEKAQKKGRAPNDVQSMSQEKQIKLALSAAPPHI